jgi:putative hydrolase of the HAD superfamily
LVYRDVALSQGVTLDSALVRARFRQEFQNDEESEAREPLATDEHRERQRWRRIVRAVLAELPDPKRAFEELWDHFGRPGAWSAYHDVAPAIAALTEIGITMCVGSNFDSRLRTVLRGIPCLSPLADSAVISSEVGFRKPHAAFFEATLRQLELPRTRVLVVGDDLENDVRGAERAGLHGLLVDRHDRRPSGIPFVTTLAGVPAVIAGESGIESP